MEDKKSIFEMSDEELAREYGEPTTIVEVNMVLQHDWIEPLNKQFIPIINANVDNYLYLSSELDTVAKTIYDKIMKGEEIEMDSETDFFRVALEIIETLETIESCVLKATNNFEKVPQENVIKFWEFLKLSREEVFEKLRIIYRDTVYAFKKQLEEKESFIQQLEAYADQLEEEKLKIFS